MLLFVVTLFCIAICAYGAKKCFPKLGIQQLYWPLLLVLMLKIIVGQWLLHKYSDEQYIARHHSDMHKYFDDGEHLHQALSEDPAHFWRIVSNQLDHADHEDPYLKHTEFWSKPAASSNYMDNRIMILSNCLMSIVSGHRITWHVVFMNAIAWWGIVMLCAAAQKWFSCSRIDLLYLTALPSVLIWGSGLLKEAWMLFAIGGILWSIAHARKIWPLVFTMIGIGFLAILKSYVAFILLPAFALLLLDQAHRLRPAMAALAYVVLLVLGVIALDLCGASLWALMQEKQTAFLAIAESAGAQSIMTAASTPKHWTEIPLMLAQSLYNAMIYPLPLMNWSSDQLIVAFEHIMILTLLGRSIRRGQWNAPAIYLALSALCLCILLGYMVPVLGSLWRYLMPASLLFLFAARWTEKAHT